MKTLLFGLCVYVCVHVYKGAYVCRCMCGGQKKTSGIVSPKLFTLVFVIGSPPIGLELIK